MIFWLVVAVVVVSLLLMARPKHKRTYRRYNRYGIIPRRYWRK